MFLVLSKMSNESLNRLLYFCQHSQNEFSISYRGYFHKVYDKYFFFNKCTFKFSLFKLLKFCEELEINKYYMEIVFFIYKSLVTLKLLLKMFRLKKGIKKDCVTFCYS